MSTNLFDVLGCGGDVAALASGAILDEDQVTVLKKICEGIVTVE